MAERRYLSGITLVLLTLLLGECMYRVAFWLWENFYPQSDLHAARVHLVAWIVATALIALSWVYVVWLSYQDGKDTQSKR